MGVEIGQATKRLVFLLLAICTFDMQGAPAKQSKTTRVRSYSSPTPCNRTNQTCILLREMCGKEQPVSYEFEINPLHEDDESVDALENLKLALLHLQRCNISEIFKSVDRRNRKIKPKKRPCRYQNPNASETELLLSFSKKFIRIYTWMRTNKENIPTRDFNRLRNFFGGTNRRNVGCGAWNLPCTVFRHISSNHANEVKMKPCRNANNENENKLMKEKMFKELGNCSCLIDRINANTLMSEEVKLP